MAAELHLAEETFALHLLLQRLEGLVDIVVTDENLHVELLFDQAVDRPDSQAARAHWHLPTEQHTVLFVLGLKGTMSEAELHVMQARMRGGLLNKAQRGELQLPLPVGFLYDIQGQVILDHDQQVQKTMQILFQSFRRLGSAGAVVKAFRDAKLLFPHDPEVDPRMESCFG